MRIITRLNIGGPAIHVTLLDEGLEKDRVQSVLVTGRIGKEEGDMSYLLSANGRTPFIIPELKREIHPLMDAVCLWKLFQVIRRERPDIVHTHMAKAGALGRLAATLAKVPIRVHTFHGHVFQGYFRSFPARFFMAVEQFLARHSDCLIAVSDHVRREICHQYRIDSGEKVRVVPLGFNLEPFLQLNGGEGFLRGELQLSPETRFIGIVGRLVPVKNHTFFLDAAEVLHRRNENIHFVIVGRGTEESNLKRIVRERGLSSCVTFLGWRRDLPRIYADLDTVVLTSKNEGTPVALIEAMASGRAVVATRVGGVPDVVRDGITGYTVSAGDLSPFVERIERLLKDPLLREQFGEAGRRWVRERFSKDQLLRNIRDLYEELLTQKRERIKR